MILNIILTIFFIIVIFFITYIIFTYIIFCPYDKSNKKDYYKYQKEHAEIFLTAKEFINLNYLAPDICSYNEAFFMTDTIYYLFYQKGDSKISIGIKSYKDYKEVNKYIKNKELNKEQEKNNQLKLELIKAVRNNAAEQRKNIINSMKFSIDRESKL